MRMKEEKKTPAIRLKTRKETTEWGCRWWMEASDKSFHFVVYRYDDDLKTIYLSNLGVRKDKRGQGLGTRILQSVDRIAKKWKADKILLWCKKDAGVHYWYQKCGYVDFKDYKDPAYVWMKKEVNEKVS